MDHMEEAEYLREREQLEGVKTELAAAQAPIPTIKLDGVHDACLKASSAGRRRLLGDASPGPGGRGCRPAGAGVATAEGEGFEPPKACTLVVFKPRPPFDDSC